MENKYLAKFDKEGRRITSVPLALTDDYGGEEKLLAEGYILISDEDWQHYVGNRGTGDNGTGYIRDAETGKPVSAPPPPLPPVESVAASTWTAVKVVRDAAEQSGCPYMGKTLDSDSTSVQRISIAVQAAQGALAAGIKGFVLDWTMQDNSVVAMTAEQVIGMSAALAAYSNELHERARVLREQIEQVVSDYQAGALLEDDARSALVAIKFGT